MRSPSPSSLKASRRGGGDGGCTGTPCCNKEGVKRGPWTADEDKLLADYIKREGDGKWRTLPKKAGLLRCGKSCRLRWMNYLRPSVKRGHISPDEEDLILRLHRLLGNRWALIAGRIPGRTDNDIKNYWNTHLSKKLISQGIDPKTHKPLNPNPSINNDNIKRDSSSSVYVPLASDNAITSSYCVNGEQDGSKINRDLINFDHDDHKGISNVEDHGGDDYDDMIMNECCSDDAFSSFLNSLINDDMFVSQNQDQQEQRA